MCAKQKYNKIPTCISSQLVAFHVAFLSKLGTAVARSDVEFALVRQVEVVGRAEARTPRDLRDGHVCEAQQLVGHEHLVLHAEVHAPHAHRRRVAVLLTSSLRLHELFGTPPSLHPFSSAP